MAAFTYEFEVSLTRAGNLRKPQTLLVRDDGNQIRYSDSGDYRPTAARQTLAADIARKLDLDAGEVEKLLDAAWNEAQSRLRDAQQADGEAVQTTASAVLVNLVQTSEVELWHTPERVGYATIGIDGHYETWGVRSAGFREWLSQLYFEQAGKSAPTNAMQEALGTIDGFAKYKGETHEVYVRVAEPDRGRIYLDLADDAWRAVEVTADGWQVLDHPPVRFKRPRGLLPIPEPVKGGRLDELFGLLNIPNDDAKLLVTAWAASTLRGYGPYPILALLGEQGTAKSTFGKFLHQLLDPCVAPLRSAPRDERDMVIAAANGRIVAYDNLSHIPVWLSDALCRLSTGGGFGTRQLYSDADQVLFDVTSPVLVTSIADVITAADLLDRAIPIVLEMIDDRARRTDEAVQEAFSAARPRILGALLSAVSAGLGILPDVRIDRKPRMADFTLWGEAVCRGAGWKEGAFVAAYRTNRREANDVVLDSAPFAAVVRQLMHDLAEWTGSATELRDRTTQIADEPTRKAKGWPTTPKAAANALRKIAPNLRRAGISVELTRDPGTGRRRITLRTGQAAPEKNSGAAHRHNGHDRHATDGADATNGEWHNTNGEGNGVTVGEDGVTVRDDAVTIGGGDVTTGDESVTIETRSDGSSQVLVGAAVSDGASDDGDVRDDAQHPDSSSRRYETGEL